MHYYYAAKKTKQKNPKKPTATCTLVTRSKRQKGAFLFMNYVFLRRNKWKFLNYCSYISIRLIKEIANSCYMSFWVWRHFVRFSISRNLSKVHVTGKLYRMNRCILSINETLGYVIQASYLCLSLCHIKATHYLFWFYDNCNYPVVSLLFRNFTCTIHL